MGYLGALIPASHALLNVFNISFSDNPNRLAASRIFVGINRLFCSEISPDATSCAIPNTSLFSVLFRSPLGAFIIFSIARSTAFNP